MRASSIHGLAGMAAIMASTYKAYMGEGLGDFGKWLMKFKIPHFGKVRHSLLPATWCIAWTQHEPDSCRIPTPPASAAASLLPRISLQFWTWLAWCHYSSRRCTASLRLTALASLLRQVGGKVAMDLTMPTMLAWVLGGNANKLRFQDRAPHCRLPDKPKTFHEQVLPGQHNPLAAVASCKYTVAVCACMP